MIIKDTESIFCFLLNDRRIEVRGYLCNTDTLFLVLDGLQVLYKTYRESRPSRDESRSVLIEYLAKTNQI